MNLYRVDTGKAADEFMDTVGGFPIAVKVLIQQGVLVEVAPCKHEILCDGCAGSGYQLDSPIPVLFRPHCRACGGAGVRIARIVIADREDTE